MIRNNRKKRRSTRGMVPVPFIVAVVVVAVASLAYIGLGLRCEALGCELKTLEAERADLTKQCLNEEYKWTQMKSPANLEKALKRYGINMMWPRSDHVVYLQADSLADRWATSTDTDRFKFASISSRPSDGLSGWSE